LRAQARDEKAVGRVGGVRGVVLHVQREARAGTGSGRLRHRQGSAASTALALLGVRYARREANHITVAVDAATVALSGEVDSLREHDAAMGRRGEREA